MAERGRTGPGAETDRTQLLQDFNFNLLNIIQLFNWPERISWTLLDLFKYNKTSDGFTLCNMAEKLTSASHRCERIIDFLFS